MSRTGILPVMPCQTGRLTDAELGRLIRQVLLRSGVIRVEVYGEPGKERVEAMQKERLHPKP